MMAIALLIPAISAIIADQIAKMIVTRVLADGERIGPVLGFGLRRAMNARAGILSLPYWAALLIWLGIGIWFGFMIVRGSPFEMPGIVGLGLVWGGATGNLIDRLTRGGVVDWIAIGRWPIFNLADASMVAGACLAFWSLL